MKKILAILLLSVSFSAVVASESFDITDVEGRTIHFDQHPNTFVVANYIANFMMVGGKSSLDKVIALTKDGWEETRFGEYQVLLSPFRK